MRQLPEATIENVKDYLLATFTTLLAIQKQLTQLEQQMADPECNLEQTLVRYGQKQEEFLQAGGYEMENRLSMIANGLTISHLLPKNLSDLSGGELTIVALARILMQENDLVLLDEPTNHLDTQRIAWLESYLAHEKIAYLIVSHDRLFLDNVVHRIIELEDGHALAYKGNYSEYKKQKEEQLEKLKKTLLSRKKK
ncbi:ATP-binding cassette domain-containing protein [Enterococcus termitis]